MKERYQKVLIWKLEEYLSGDVATQMLEADLGGKPSPFFLVCVDVCVCVGGGSKFDMKIMET
jgi:hypothetical protein